MSKFRVGDKWENKNWADVVTIEGIDEKGDPITKERGSFFKDTLLDNYKLIERSEPMSKYDELKQRIEAVKGWGKEADDLLQEIGFKGRLLIDDNCNNQDGNILIITHGTRAIKGCLSITGDVKAEFFYHSQCQKLAAFKQALMWLLDNSDIKKTIVGSEQKVEIEGKVYKAKIIEEA